MNINFYIEFKINIFKGFERLVSLTLKLQTDYIGILHSL